MATVRDIYMALDRRAPFRYQMSFDNAGLLVGRADREVNRILVALDITPEVIEEAVERGCDLIVAHHPVIWDKLGAVTDEGTTGRRVLALIEHQIAAICAHTNLDAVEGGVNTELARRIGLLDPVVLEPAGVDEDGRHYGIGRAGALIGGPMSAAELAAHVTRALELQGVRLLDAGRPIARVAVGGGACAGMLPAVQALGCDAFVTGDVKHDLWLEARALGITLIDAGHYGTETVVCPVLAGWLREDFPEIETAVAEEQGEAFVYL